MTYNKCCQSSFFTGAAVLNIGYVRRYTINARSTKREQLRLITVLLLEALTVNNRIFDIWKHSVKLLVARAVRLW